MKRKPWAIVILSLLHILAPFGNLLLNSMRSGRSLESQWMYWSHALPKPLFLCYILLPPLAGVFIYICRRWSYWAYLVSLMMIFAVNIYAFWSNLTWATFLFLLLVIIVDFLAVAYFVVPSVKRVYFDPRLRWWEAAPRYVFDCPVTINKGGQGQVKNISFGGLFLGSDENLVETQGIELIWNYEGHEYRVAGTVVYKTKAGIGVKFNHLPESVVEIKRLIKDLHRKGLIVKERLPGPEDSFGSWLRKLFRDHEGLFPKV